MVELRKVGRGRAGERANPAEQLVRRERIQTTSPRMGALAADRDAIEHLEQTGAQISPNLHGECRQSS